MTEYAWTENKQIQYIKINSSQVLFSKRDFLARGCGCLPYLAFSGSPTGAAHIFDTHVQYNSFSNSDHQECTCAEQELWVHTDICTCKLSNNQLQPSHRWLVHEGSSLSAKDQLENSGQVQLEAVLRLMYIPTLISWHAHLWVSQCHITHLQYNHFLVLATMRVWHLCSFRIPGNPFTHHLQFLLLWVVLQ